MSSYAAASELSRSAAGQQLGLATALGLTPDGPVDHPSFFSGFVTRPDVTAAGLLAVADVAGSRYADAGLATRLANLDPVVTAGGDRLRFESFSACNGVYARFDLLPEGLGSSSVGFGTTNVDINQPLRTALARVNRHEPLHLEVGAGELRAALPAATHVERKVSLPDRWVRGLAEVPTLLSEMEPAGSLVGAAVAHFLAQLPRPAPPGPELWVLPLRSPWRTATRPVPGGVHLPGASRLAACGRVARFATRLTVHVHPHGSTAWVFDVPGGRLTLTLSPGPFRGFSGEGTLLTFLIRSDAEPLGRRLLAELGWSSVVDPALLGAAAGLGSGQVCSGLAWLAASGRLGYDVSDTAWFHRELPIDAEAVIRRHPRATSAHRIMEKAGVTPTGTGGWRVRGGRDRLYLVRSEDSRLACECTWEREHQGTRGPCKHVLAVLVWLREADPAKRS